MEVQPWPPIDAEVIEDEHCRLSYAATKVAEQPSGLVPICPPEDDSHQLSQVQTDGDPEVWIHIYHCDPYTGWLNKALLKNREIGIYHAGVEVYGEEWSFQYFEDSWDDPSVSGVIRCPPKCMTDYEYQESVNLGLTPFSEEEVDQILLTLHYEWPACNYHLTNNNCLTFAEHLVKLLNVSKPFPAWLKGILEASHNNQPVNAVVDYSWSWMKWWMMRKHRQENPGGEPCEDRCPPPKNIVANVADSQEPAHETPLSLWTLLMYPGHACTGTLCPGGTRRTLNTDCTNPEERHRDANFNDMPQ